MSLKFICSSCGKEIAVKFLKPGETARCKNCDSEMPVPEDAIDDGSSSPDGPQPTPDTTGPAGLSSEGIGKVLVILLWVGLVVALALFSLTFYLKDSLSPLTHSTAGWTLIAIILLAGPVFIVQAIVFLLWLARVHLDLRRFYPDYLVSPGKSVACLLIPVYHLWGVWHVFSTMAATLKRDELGSGLTTELSKWLIALVVTLVFDYVVVVEMIVGFFGATVLLTYESMFSTWDVIVFGVGIFSAIVCLRVAVLVRALLRLKHSG